MLLRNVLFKSDPRKWKSCYRQWKSYSDNVLRPLRRRN